MRYSLITILALAACARTPRPTVHAEPYMFAPAHGAPVAAELGTLEVPEDRTRPSRRIALRYVRFAAITPHPGAPIIYLAGGPGASGIESARGARFGVFMALRAVADVIALDQRGTGQSGGALDCSERYQAPLDQPLTPTGLADAVGEAARRCADRLVAEGVALTGYNTLESVADLEDLRRALGAERLTLWGTSYGTTLALAALQRVPVERVIIAGVEPLDQMLKLPSDQQQLLETVSRLAAAAGAHRDLTGAIARLLAQLSAAPVRVAAGEGALVLGPLDLQITIAEMLRGPQTLSRLPGLIAQLETGDWRTLAALALPQRAGRLPSMMSIAMDCASGASADWRQRIAREAASTLLRDAINAPLPAICERLPIRVLDDAFRNNPRSNVPVLAISGTLDGRTPVTGAERVLAGLPHGHRLILDGAGHGDDLFIASPRITETMLRFLRGEPVTDERVALPALTF